MIQIINSLIRNRYLRDIIWGPKANRLLNSLRRLLVKSELSIPFIVIEISSALFKLDTINLICCLIFIVEHLKLLADLAVAWKFPLAIRILIYIFVSCSHFHLVF